MIRVATEADAPDLLAIYAPYVRDTSVTFEYEVPSVSEFEGRVRDVLAVYPYLVYEREGKICGYAYAHRHMPRAAYAWCAETTVYVDAQMRRAGIGGALYRALLELLAMQGVRSAHACVTQPNAPSDALHARFGFTPVGVYHHAGYKMNMWHDVCWYEKPLVCVWNAPEPLVPFSALNAQAVAEVLNGSEAY